MPRATLSTKGQIVIPRELRQRHRLVPGASFEIESDGENIVLRQLPEVRATTLGELVGCTGYRGPRRSLADMERAIARGARERS